MHRSQNIDASCHGRLRFGSCDFYTGSEWGGTRMRHDVLIVMTLTIAVTALPRRMPHTSSVAALIPPTRLPATTSPALVLAPHRAIALPSPAGATNKKEFAAAPATHVDANGFHRCRRLWKGRGIDGNDNERLS